MMKNMVLLILFTTTLTFAQEDHSAFIEGPFDTPQEITETCLMCHEVGDEIMKTRHWNWLRSNVEESDSEYVNLGKRNLINNFCIAVPSNWPRCTSCHISYGWEDADFDFEDPSNIDCLVCHDQTGTYQKIPTGAGMPDTTIDLEAVAQSVGNGSPTRQNCGNCHFNGGGGTGVKHGDMDGSLIEPTMEIDVHMGGMDFSCTECHYVDEHKIAGGSHGSMAAGGENLIGCTDCHAEAPHEKELLNDHVVSVACESCHIPSFAREEPTIVYWDWSTAGEDREQEISEFEKENYNKKKGSFKWNKNVIPTYRWTNGSADYYTYGEKLDPDKIVMLNELGGNIKDPESKIAPFKVMKGKQPYDAVNNYLIVPKLYGEGGFWQTFDWKTASENGMAATDLEFSGEVGFIETEMYWPINHMVAPADNALGCTSCHGKGGENRIDWEKIGYPDDPLKKGTRKELGFIE